MYGKTRVEVHKKLQVMLRKRELGDLASLNNQSVKDFLTNWLDTKRDSLRSNTYRRYCELARLHVIPEIGRYRLNRVTPQKVQELYRNKLLQGQSASSVRQMHAVLSVAFKQALQWGQLERNVMSMVIPPRRADKDIQPLTVQEARAVLEAAEGDKFEALYILALTAGLRRGELFALRWRDLDLGNETMRVAGTLLADGTIAAPKTAKSRRGIALTPIAIEAIKRRRIIQMEDQLLAGERWSNEENLVFTNLRGKAINPSNFSSRNFRQLLEKSGIRRIRFHDLRHSTASLLLSLNVHPKIVQELLGHSQISITLDTYSHVLPSLQEEALGKLGGF